MSRVRLLRAAIAAAAALMALKSVSLLRDIGASDPPARPAEAIAPRRLEPPRPPEPEAPQPFGRAITRGRASLAGDAPVDVDITGAVPSKPKPKPESKPAGEAIKGPGGQAPPDVGRRVDLDKPPAPPVSPAERALLERLGERRKSIEAREAELATREQVLGAAEKRIEARLEELKALEARLDAARKERESAEAARSKSLVTLYESMKPKEAARVFERMEARVLIDLAGRMTPRKLSEVLAAMSPEAAGRLTSAMARRGEAPTLAAAPAGELPDLPPPRPARPPDRQR